MDFSNIDFSEWLLYDRLKFEKEVGLELGRNEGIKIGRNEGIKIGRNEGKLNSMINVIKNMQKNLYSKDEILECTGLNEKEYEKYAKMIKD